MSSLLKNSNFSDATGALKDIFGGSQSQSTNGTTVNSGIGTESLDISNEAISKIIQDVLGGAGGLAEIFGGEQSTGLYNSSAANQAAGDVTSKLVGEIAKLKAKKVSTTDTTSETSNTTKQSDSGLVGQVGDLFAGAFGW